MVEAEKLNYEGFTLNYTNESKHNGIVDKTGNLKLKLYYKRNTHKLKINNVEGASIVFNNFLLEKNIEQITKFETKLALNIDVEKGYVFKGWKITNEQGTEVNINLNDEQKEQYNIETKMPDANLIIEPIVEIENYNIEYDLKGGKITGECITTYNIKHQEFDLNEPTKNGYIFRGWTGSNGIEPEKKVTIKKGTYGNLQYTANWVMQVDKPIINCENEKYTNNSTKVAITYPEAQNTTNQYRKYGENWVTVEENPYIIDCEENTIIYARTISQQGEATEIVEKQINNIDKISPEINNISISKTELTNQNVKVTVITQDKQSGIVGYKFTTKENADENDWEEIETTKDEIIKEFVVNTNGTYYFYVKDLAGNVTKAKDGKIVINNIEKTKPIITVARDESFVSKTKTIKIDINYEGKSKLSENNSYQYYISKNKDNLEGGEWKNYAPGENFAVGENLTGEYFLFIKEVQDELGNISENNGTKLENYHIFSSLMFDNSAPNVNFENNGNSVYKKEQKTKVNVEDVGNAGLNIENLKYLWTQNINQPNTEDFTEKFANGDEIKLNEGNGIFYLWIMSEDNAGNINLQRSNGFYLDNQMPTNKKPTVQNITNSTISVEVKQEDEKSQIDANNIYFGIKESTSEEFSWIKSNKKIYNFKNLKIGKKYDIRTKVKDNAGNGYVESEILSNIELNNSEDIYIMQTPTNWTNDNVYLTITYPSYDMNVKKHYSTNNKDWIQVEEDIKEINIEANTTIYTRILDEDGAIIKSTQHTISNIDKQKPNVEIKESVNTYEIKNANSALINIDLVIEDTGSGILKQEYAWSNTNTVAPTKWNIINDTKKISENKTIGEYYLWVRAKDNAQNETLKVSNKYIIKEVQSYSIQYNALGGTGAPSTQKKYINDSINLSTKVPTKTGYTFLGWATKEGANKPEYNPGAKYNVNANTTFYAVWEKAIYKNANTYYSTLSAAVKNAKSNDIITVLENSTENSEIVIDKNITLDLNGKNMAISKTIIVNANSTLIISGNGNISNSQGIILIQNNGNLNLVGNINLTNTSKYADYVIKNQGTFNNSGTGKISSISKTIGNIGSLVINSGTIESKEQNTIINIGDIKINGGNIVSTNAIAIGNGENGKIEMNKGTITGGQVGILHDSKNELKILGGTVTGKKHGINNSQTGIGSIILGKESDTTIVKNPIILGDEYGIYTLNSSGKILLYNGIIKGKKGKGYEGNITCRDKYELLSTKLGEYLEIGLIMAKEKNYSIGNNNYESLSEAIKNAKSGDKIKVIKNVNDANAVTIDKNVTLDTNGYSLTRTIPINVNEKVTLTITGNGNLIMKGSNHLIINKGTLKITHTGTIKNENTGSYNTIYNLGTLEKTGTGTIENLGKNNAILNFGTTTITAGKVTCKNANTFRNNKNEAKLTVNGGTIENTGDFYAINNSTFTGTVNISGGTVTTNYRTIYNEIGTINIKGGTINSKYYGIRQKGAGKINISGGTVKATASSKAYGIIIENAKNVTKITGGTVQGTDYGIYDTASSNITIGTSSGSINKTNPTIIGDKFSVYMPNATTKFNFYSGILKGKTTPGYYGGVNTRSGYSPITEYSGGYFNTTVGTATYSISTTPVSYTTSLPTAINCANSGATITLLKNSTLTSGVTINKNLVLDTNGKKLTSEQTITIAKGTTATIAGSGTITSQTASKTLIANAGTLKLTHTGTISRTNDSNDNNYVISNTGTISKTGTGKIKADNRAILNTGGTVTMSAGTISVEGYIAINNKDNGVCNLNGGTVESKNDCVIYHNSAKNLTINGATVKMSSPYGYEHAIQNRATGNVIVKKGTVDGYFTSIQNYSTGKIYIQGGEIGKIVNSKEGEINVSGGTITSCSENIVNNGTGTVNITGGKLQGQKNVGSTGIENNGTGTINFKGGTIDVGGTGIENKSTGTINVTGGIIKGGTCIDNGPKGILNISNGTMDGGEGWYTAIHAAGTGSITITGGTIKGYKGIVCVNEKITITGGNITGKYRAIETSVNAWGNEAGKGTLTISGGQIRSTIDTYSCMAIEYKGKKTTVTGGTIRGTIEVGAKYTSTRNDMGIVGECTIKNLKYKKFPCFYNATSIPWKVTGYGYSFK